MSYRSSSKHPCPVCGRTKDGDCAIDYTPDGVKVRCHTYLEDAEVPGFVYRGKTACGTWGLYYQVADPTDRPKSLRPASKREFFYPAGDGSPLAKVVRKDDGMGHKSFSQWHWENGKWVAGLPPEYQKHLHLYRIHDELNQAAIRTGDRILLVEGEGKVDLLLSMGIPATCAIGGAGKWRHYGYPNYLEDLQGARVVLVPDRDSKGLEHMEDVAKDFQEKEWLFPFSESPLWHRLPEKGGLDIADWIEEGKLSREQVLSAIGIIPQLERSQVKPKPEPRTLANVLEELQRIFANNSEVSQLWDLGSLSKSVGRSVKELLNIWEAQKESHRRFQPLSLRGLMERPELERQWLIGGFVPGGSVIGLVAAGGTGKTLLAYDLVKAIASGRAWNGLPVHQGKCLIIQADEQWTDMRERLEIAGFRDLDPESVYFVEHWQFAQMSQLADAVREHGFRFCVIDSFTSTNRRSAAEEKDTAYAKCLYDLRDLASESGCTFLVLHHTNKAGGARGTTAFEDNVSEVWFLTREKAEGFTPHHRQLEIRKSRSGCTGKWKLLLDVDDYSWKLEGDMDEIPGSQSLMTRVLEYLQQCPGVWVEPEELCHAFSAPKSRDAMRKTLERLRKKGLVVAEDRVKVCNERGGKTRYKVYMYPDPNVQRHQTLSQTASWSLDASLDKGDGVQRQNGLKPAPRAESLSLDAFSQGEGAVQRQNKDVQRPESAPRAESVSLDAPEEIQPPQLAQVAQVAQGNPAVGVYDQEVNPAPRIREDGGDLSLDAFDDVQRQDKDVQRPQIGSQTASWSLDAFDDVQRQNGCVQRPEPAPRAENLSLDTSTSDTPQKQLAQVAQSLRDDDKQALANVAGVFDGVVVDPRPIQQTLDLAYSSRNDCQFQQYFQYDGSREIPKIKVGDRVRYVGRGENGLFTIKGLAKEVLTVLAVDRDLGVARVTSPNWNFMPNYQTIDLKHLKRI